MLGYEPGALEETRERWLERMHPEDRERVAKELEGYLADDRPVFASEFRQKRTDGKWRWILSVGKIVQRNAAGEPVRMLGIHADVTQRHEAETEKVILEQQLAQAQKMESIGRLAGGVAHDFNNMLSVIIGHTELIRLQLGREDRAVDGLDDIERAALHSRDITRQLLAFSRKQIITPVMLDLNEVVKTTSKTLGRLIGEDVELRFYPGRDLWPIKFDPTQIDQILVNLAVNARDAMPSGGKLTVETSNVYLDERYGKDHLGCDPGYYVMLGVSDTGCGMDQATLAHIFEPFFTTKGSGEGTGLGLATVYGAIRQNGGYINVYSEPDSGTSFKMYIPRLAGIESSAPRPEDGPLPRGSGTVLLVEDDPMVRTITAAMLAEIGYDVIVAKSAVDALELCRERHAAVDLLLTDVVMPTMNGAQLAKEMRAFRSDIRVLYMSGYTNNVIVHHGVLEEGLRFLHKPFSVSALATAVREAMSDEI
jgi:PAS domain S-box-containing protein